MLTELHRGRARSGLRTGIAVIALSTTMVALAPTSPALADASLADIALAVTANPTTVSTIGGTSDIAVDLRNVGTRAANDVTVVITLPSGATLAADGVYFAEWNCDFSTTPIWTCTHGPLAAGTTAELLSIPLHLSGGTDGEAVSIRTAAATSSPEFSSANNIDQVTLHYAAADLAVTMAAVPGDVVVGSRVTLKVSIQNIGAGSSTDPRVDVSLPAPMRPVSPSGSEGWDCSFGRDVVTGVQGWACGHRGPLAAGEVAEPLHLFATVESGTPGETLTFTSTVRPVDQEPSTANNTAQASVDVVEPGTIRGMVWLDNDRDGKRDSGELGDADYVYELVFLPQAPVEGDPTEITVTVNPDGTYAARLKPGPYIVQVRVEARYYDFTISDKGNEAIDSDIVEVQRNIYVGIDAGNSDVINVAAGSDTTIDAGVVDRLSP